MSPMRKVFRYSPRPQILKEPKSLYSRLRAPSTMSSPRPAIAEGRNRGSGARPLAPEGVATNRVRRSENRILGNGIFPKDRADQISCHYSCAYSARTPRSASVTRARLIVRWVVPPRLPLRCKITDSPRRQYMRRSLLTFAAAAALAAQDKPRPRRRWSFSNPFASTSSPTAFH